MRITLCEFASVHADSTFSIVRGGIDLGSVPELPGHLLFYAFIEVPPDTLPPGPSPLTVSVTAPDGTPVSSMTGVAITRSPNLVSRYSWVLPVDVAQWGRFSVTADVGTVRATVEFVVQQIAFPPVEDPSPT